MLRARHHAQDQAFVAAQMADTRLVEPQGAGCAGAELADQRCQRIQRDLSVDCPERLGVGCPGGVPVALIRLGQTRNPVAIAVDHEVFRRLAQIGRRGAVTAIIVFHSRHFTDLPSKHEIFGNVF